MSLPKEPRQLMINLMYLVLTALLAMNVSSEILNAFKIVDKSLVLSSKNITEKNKTVLDEYNKLFENEEIKRNPEKIKKLNDYKPLLEKASQLGKPLHLCELQKAHAYLLKEIPDLKNAKSSYHEAGKDIPKDTYYAKFNSELEHVNRKIRKMEMQF